MSPPTKRSQHFSLALDWFRTGSRKELCQWLCEQHNLVNLKLGKQPFSCDMSILDERWRRSSKDECRK
jgi:mitochondrial FAD-linked sulfhydryl oxidase